MSLELIRESVKILRIIGENSIRTVIDNDIIVPDSKPDIAEILLLDGEVLAGDIEVLQDKLLVNGTIKYKILYAADDSSRSIKNIDFSTGFSCSMDIDNAGHGMKGDVRLDVEHIDYNIANGRKINIKAIIAAEGNVQDEVEQDIAGDIRGVDTLQVLKDNIGINCYMGSNRTEYTVKEGMDIPGSKPAIKEILRSDIKVLSKDYKVADNKVIAKGELNISTLYTADEEVQSLQFMEHEIPFTHFVDLPGIDETAECKVNFRITDSVFEAAENSDGELRLLNGEITISIDVEGYRKKNVDLLLDAYSPAARLEFENDSFKIEETVNESRSQVILKDTASAMEGSPEMAEIFNVLAKPLLSDYSITDDRIVIEGVVNSSILYLTNDEEHPVYCIRKEFPFRHSTEIKGLRQGMSCDIDLDFDHCNYSMLPQGEVEVRLVVGVDTKARNQVSVPLIIKAFEQHVDEREMKDQAGIVIYFARPGDNLWSVAKRYLTTVDEIQRNNDLTADDSIEVGQQIFIYK